MGQVCLQLARYQGAGFICAVDPLPDRRDLAVQFGATAAVNPFEQDAAAMLAQYGEFDVVIEAAGTQSVIDLATDLVKQHGRMILVGYHQSNNGQRSVNMQQWNFKAIDVVNGHVRRNDEKLAAMKEGVRLMQQGHLNTVPLVTIYPLSAAEQAFQELVNTKPGLLKAVLVPA
jgi:threonine dehydrogenase-like Zn-dependent dehydrogenase